MTLIERPEPQRAVPDYTPPAPPEIDSPEREEPEVQPDPGKIEIYPDTTPDYNPPETSPEISPLEGAVPALSL